MARTKLVDQLVEVPDDEDAYYRTVVLLEQGSEVRGTCTLPNSGSVQVEKEFYAYPQPHLSFAWKVA